MTTIYALATPPVKSAIAIIRISGGDSLKALSFFGITKPLEARKACYLKLKNQHGELVDDVIAIYFKAPNSFTGEGSLELHTHGGRAVIAEILGILGHIPGFRPAEPGEFTRRALMNGKMDLLEAEGIQDLIAADTIAQKKQARRQMGGGASSLYESLRTRMIKALAYLEAYIDFPDEDMPAEVISEIESEVAVLKEEISVILTDGRAGEMVREGVRVVITGAPNAGKSSLLNALAGREAAIVSARPGTTRDIVSVQMEIGGLPFIMYDTAGIRETADDIEIEGIRRAVKAAAEADIVIHLTSPQDMEPEDIKPFPESNTLNVLSKCDLPATHTLKHDIQISTQTREGLEQLELWLAGQAAQILSRSEGAYITNLRHRTHLEQALIWLDEFTLTKPIELACEDLRLAATEIGRITGRIGVEELLDSIFRNFCIGK